MIIRKIDVDTLIANEGATWGRVTADVDGQEVVLRLNPEQIARLTAPARDVASEILERLSAVKAA